MNTLNSLKCAVVLLPALAVGIPMANAGDEKRDDPRQVTAQHGFLETLPAHGYHSDSLVGREVMNRRNNETIGEVSNLVLDKNGQVVAVVVSVGGIMGIGERDLAIEWNQIERKVDGDDITLSVDLNEASLKGAPKYPGETTNTDREQQRTDRADKRTDRADQRADRADQRTDRADRADKRQANTSPAKPAAASTRTRATENVHHQFVETIPARGYHSDSLVGREVMNRRNNESVGEVSNLLLDENGQVVAVILSVGGLMGIGERDVAISWDQIERKLDGDEITLTVDLTEQSLKDAPKYPSETKRSRR